MAFKSYTCITDTLTPVPPEGWNAVGDTVVINNNNDTAPLFAMPCDPELSYFLGAAPTSTGMTYEEFTELWPLLLLIMFAGYGVKKIRSIFDH
jgi:hypothetical protein